MFQPEHNVKLVEVSPTTRRTSIFQLELNDTEKAELQLQARRAIGRVSERIHFVLLSAQGHSPVEIGNLMGYNVASIRTWLSAYRDGGVAALDDAARSGRPRKAQHIDDVVEAQVGQPPTVYGYLQAIWTVTMLAQHLTRFGIQVSAATVRRALNRMRFSWHRPKYSPARRPDPKRTEKMAHLAQVLRDFAAHIVAVDECDFHLMPPLRAMWQRIGQQLRLPTVKTPFLWTQYYRFLRGSFKVALNAIVLRTRLALGIRVMNGCVSCYKRCL